MIPYIGSKAPLHNWIVPTIPSTATYYVEPFGGMFSLFFSLDLTKYPHTQFIYNEINPYHINLFHHLQDLSFRQQVKKLDLTIVDYMDSFATYTLLDEIGALSWLRILCGSKDLRNIMVPNFRGNWAWTKLMDALLDLPWNSFQIEALDFRACLQKYDSPATFFYVDPPYYGYEDYYTFHSFQTEDHLALKNELLRLKGNWSLSYYNFPHLTQWYQGQQIQTKKVGLGIEYLITK